MSFAVDEEYWKKLYEKVWPKSKKREDTILSLIQEAGFSDAQLVGFGAGSSKYLRGSPTKHGKKKGDPDIEIPSIEVAVEVTGTDVQSVTAEHNLWVRPDKIQNAHDHPERDTWIVHVLDRKAILRTIHLIPETIRRLLLVPRIHPTIRGAVETYIPIEANDKIVKPFTELLDHLNAKKALLKS